MQITITTKVTGGHLIVYIIDKNTTTILTANDNDTQQKSLVPGEKYRLEWHSWGPSDAEYIVNATISPANTGFPDYNLDRKYTGPNTDMGGFTFTLA